MLSDPGVRLFLSRDDLPYDDLTRRRLLGGLAGSAAAGVLTACGAGSDPGRGGTTAATRTVVDDDGREVEVPVDPQRVVILNEEHSAHLTTLGYAPVGQGWAYQPDFVETLTEFGGDTPDLSSVADAGPTDEIDYEKVLALRPDLVIGWNGLEARTIERLSAIAPYVGVDARTDRDGEEFAQVRLLADLVGVRDRAEARIAEYQQALADARATYADELDGLDYSYLDFFDGTMYSYNLPGYAVNAVMSGLGVAMSRAMREATDQGLGYPEDPDSGYATFSVELVADYDAGLVFVGTGVTDPASASVPAPVRAALTGTHAAREDQVLPVSSNLWTFHLLESNLRVLERLEQLFAGQDVVPRPA